MSLNFYCAVDLAHVLEPTCSDELWSYYCIFSGGEIDFSLKFLINESHNVHTVQYSTVLNSKLHYIIVN